MSDSAAELVATHAEPATPRGSTLMSRTDVMRQSLQEETEQRVILGEYVARNMVSDVDYGVIPGTKNKTLLKPGAEKLVNLFRCTAVFTVSEQVQDWDAGLFHYRITCDVLNSAGTTVAQGLGSANSREPKWRYVTADRTCTVCGKATIIKGKEEYGGGWLCFAKKGGCGAKFFDDDTAITGQAVGKIENPDPAGQCNTILKIAKKRALVDAAVSLARCSDMFTQDMDEEPTPPLPEKPKPKAKLSVPAALALIRACESMEALRETFDGLPPYLQKAVKVEKDHKKEELSEVAKTHSGDVMDPVELTPAQQEVRDRLNAIQMPWVQFVEQHAIRCGVWSGKGEPPKLDRMGDGYCDKIMKHLEADGVDSEPTDIPF